MNTHADKTHGNKRQSVANKVTQKQSGSESFFQFVDNRPEAVAQRKLQEMANDSPQVSQLRAFQEIADNSRQSMQLKSFRTPTTSNEVVQLKKYYRFTKDRKNVVECSENAYKNSRFKATENDYFKHNERMKEQMAPIPSRTYETEADQDANVGQPAERRQRSGSVHVPTRNRSGSVDIMHYHDNINSAKAPINRNVGHIDRDGVRTGRPADPTSRTGTAPVTKPEGKDELTAEDIAYING